MEVTLFAFIFWIIVFALSSWRFYNEYRINITEGDLKKIDTFDLKCTMMKEFIKSISVGFLVVVVIITLTVVFGTNGVAKTTYDAEPKNFQILVNFSAYNSNVFYVDDGENMTFITGGTRPGPLIMATVTTNKDNCQIFDDCPRGVESYVVTRTVKTEYRQRWLIFYMELPNEISYLYELHLHPNEIAGL